MSLLSKYELANSCNIIDQKNLLTLNLCRKSSHETKWTVFRELTE